jgi:hypothetical protein
MDNSRRAAGLGLLTYGLATTVAFIATAAPGGEYSDRLVRGYIGSSHWMAAFIFCYLGAFGAVGLLFFRRWHGSVGSVGDVFRSLLIAGAATSVVGWFVDAGVAVSMAEGGRAVQSGVPHTVVYTLTETGNLLAICAPAFFVGLAALLIGMRTAQPRFLRVFCIVAGVCGILAPLYFTYFAFVLWTLVFSGWMIAGARRGTRVELPQASLV